MAVKEEILLAPNSDKRTSTTRKSTQNSSKKKNKESSESSSSSGGGATDTEELTELIKSFCNLIRKLNKESEENKSFSLQLLICFRMETAFTSWLVNKSFYVFLFFLLFLLVFPNKVFFVYFLSDKKQDIHPTQERKDPHFCSTLVPIDCSSCCPWEMFYKNSWNSWSHFLF